MMPENRGTASVITMKKSHPKDARPEYSQPLFGPSSPPRAPKSQGRGLEVSRRFGRLPAFRQPAIDMERPLPVEQNPSS
jgi:hypothetical protein